MRGPRRRRFRVMVVTCLVVAVVMVAAIAKFSAKEPGRVVVCQTSETIGFVGLWVGLEQGFFKKHGVEVEVLRASGATSGLQAVIAGEAQFVIASAIGGLPARAAGVDVAYITSLGRFMPYLLVTGPHITSPSDLKGKRVGVTSAGLGASRVAVSVALDSLGLDPSRDNITFTVSGSVSERLAAVTAGSIDGTVVPSEHRARLDELVAQGHIRILADLTVLGLPWEQDCVMVLESWAHGNPETVEGFLKGLVEGNLWAMDPENKDAVLQSLARNLGLDSPQQAETAYEFISLNIDPKPYPVLEAVESIINLLASDFPEIAGVKAEEFVDRTWIERLDREGFFDQLTGG